jgi:ribosomal protein L14E/L6E/L27E
MFMKRFSPRILYPFVLAGAFSSQAAILDDLVEKIQHETTSHTAHHRKHRSRHHASLSKEAKWQSALQYLGYYHGKIDGDLATQTSFDAIIAFHTEHGQMATGFLEEEDKRYLLEVYRKIALKKYLSYEGKNRRKNNQKLQAALAQESLYHGKIDGRFGKASQKALKRYTLQLDSNGTEMDRKEIEARLVRDAREKVIQKLERIKQEPYDPTKYLSAAGE